MNNMYNKIDIIIVCDSLHSAELTRNMLGAMPEVSIKGTYDNVEDALMAISLHKPELIIMRGDVATTAGKHLFNLLDIDEQSRCVFVGETHISGHGKNNAVKCMHINNEGDLEEWRHLRLSVIIPMSQDNKLLPRDPSPKIILKARDKYVFTSRDHIKFIKEKIKTTEIHFNGGKLSIDDNIESVCTMYKFNHLLHLSIDLRVNTEQINTLHAISNGSYEIEFSDGSPLLLDDLQTKTMITWLQKQTKNLGKI